jgi:protein-disulfide isomerase
MENMKTISSLIAKKGFPFQWNFWLIGLALIVGLIFSILSWLELCVEHCSANQDYRLFHLPFAIIGMTFFTILILGHFLSLYYHFLSVLVGWMIASALGAEVMFIAVQKYQIGHWCPVCLSIAASVTAAALVLVIGFLKNFKVTIEHNRGDIMQKIKQGLTSLSFVLLGFLLSFVGISKTNDAEAAVNDIKERLAFGVKHSQVEVYFVSDWFCPSCKKVEPLIEKLYPSIRSKATFYFVDYPIHKKSLNFTPYNLAFLINNKPQYFQARTLLSNLTEETETPHDEDVEKAASKHGIVLKELSFLDVKAGIDYFDKIVEKYNLNSTPTIIITNVQNNRVVKFEGRDEISEEKVLQAIEKMRL